MEARVTGVRGIFGGRKMGLVIWCVLLVGLCQVGCLVECRALGLSEVGPLCEKSGQNVGGNVAGCCRALAIANDQGCFCGGSPRDPLLRSVEACKLDLYTYGSLECASLHGSSNSWSVPKSFVRKPQQKNNAICKNFGFEDLEVTEQLELDGHFTDDEAMLDDGHQSSSSSRGLLLGVGGFFVTCASFLCPCWRQKKDNDRETDSQSIISVAGSNPPSKSFSYASGVSPRAPTGPNIVAGANFHFTMTDILRATDNFSPSRKIGQGGFGLVYKGKLPDDQIVAIKRAKRDAFEARLSVEFQTEVNALSQVEHLNLVKLIGYLEENQERILVVEYVNNGNLREHLDGTGPVLDIGKRLDIAIDVAHALTYLHTYSDRPIIHRDVKSSNILLTDTYRAKVADFGFSRAGPEEAGATHVSTQVKGTAGYLDPEYLNSYQLTQKSDVYSYGILLIEIVTGRRPIELKRASDERVTVRWAWKKVTDGRVAEILDPKLEKTQPALIMVEKVAELAFACSAPSRNDRPLMAEAVRQLWTIRTEYQSAIREYNMARSSSNMSLGSNKDRADYRYDSSGLRSPNSYMFSSPR